MIFLSWEALTFPSLSENRNYHSCPFQRIYVVHIKKHTHPSKKGTNVLIIRGSTQIPDQLHMVIGLKML